MSWPPGEPSLGQAAAGQAVATMIPRGSARTAGIPAGNAASIRAAIPAGPPSPQAACRRSDTGPPEGHPSAAATASAPAAQMER
jgi:hypothetical protein